MTRLANALVFAWRSLVRQPARTTLGVLGVAAVGALLFDMLLLSQGLIVSMRDLLDRTGYDVRVTATDALPRQGPPIRDAALTVAALAALPSVGPAIGIRFADARIDRRNGAALMASFQGVTTQPGSSTPWSVLAGHNLAAPLDIVVNPRVAATLGIAPGATLGLRASCRAGTQALPPVRLRVAGIATFPFELAGEHTIGGSLETVARACGEAADQADMILAASTTTPGAAANAIRRLRPDLFPATNEEMLGRIQRTGFTYFQQISTVLTTVTISFALLLITVLLTVSVNQRLGELAALRALGFSRARLVTDVLCESALIVGIGGALSLPLGGALAIWLDDILKRMPGIPTDLHFFVFDERALIWHVGLLIVTAALAALYPMRIVARLPIAATLRSEVIG